MTTENQNPDEKHVFEQYTKEQLELIELFNRVSYSKAAYEMVARHQEELHQLNLQAQANGLKLGDLHLESMRDAMRPHKMYHTEVLFDPNEGKYLCRLSHMFEDDEDDSGQPILAYGDTPAQACDNFDHRWIHGDTEV